MLEQMGWGQTRCLRYWNVLRVSVVFLQSCGWSTLMGDTPEVTRSTLMVVL